MPVTKRLEVKKTIVLDFSLPGVTSHSSTYTNHERWLKDNHNESWTISVDQDNALATATVFEELAKAIRESMT